MKDLQSETDDRKITINEVGISELKMPLFYNIGKENRYIVAEVSMGVRLDSQKKGIHMSRLAEISGKMMKATISGELLKSVLESIIKNLESDYSRIHLLFVIFLTKKSPVSKKRSIMDYRCSISGELENNVIKYTFDIRVPIATLCPCSKEISKFGAHNQRAMVDLQVSSTNFLKIEDLIWLVEKASSGELYTVLKRTDEKYMTERMYSNPKFVEDIVRDITLQIKKDDRITDFKVTCKSFESIHNHNAYAIINNNQQSG